MGIGAQMLLWPESFCTGLVNAGFRVIRFDNRDVGLSGKTTQSARLPRWLLMLRAQLGWSSTVPYSLIDMANDATRLLDHLQIKSAHVLGASMGGMIAQVLASEHPTRVQFLTILFSSTNQPLLPPPSPALLRLLLRRFPAGTTRSQWAIHQKRLLRAIGSPGHPLNEDDLDALVRQLYLRDFDPAGVQRQLAALLGTGDLRRYTKRILANTLVIHGLADRMIPPACGRAVARSIPNARLELIAGMAHDLPDALQPEMIEMIKQHCFP
jgi:pimeloyl-ACP methyl ester carboxylesterase